MADLSTLMSSANEHYCTPPEIVRPMRRVLVPVGSGRKLFDPSSNGASIVGADAVADGDRVDGLIVPWDSGDAFYVNPPYGRKLKDFAAKAAYWGRTRGTPGISLTPSRTDTGWDEEIKDSADAWVETRGRITFWTPIPIRRAQAIDRKGEPIFLQRWWPWADEGNLPKPFRLLSDGLAVGPELGINGKPQPAPFPSLIAFWADPKAAAAEPDPRAEIEALRELVRVSVCDVLDSRRRAEQTHAERAEHARWLVEAERLLGKIYNDDDPMRLDVFEPIITARKRKPKYPIDVRTFAQHFLPLGRLTVARGPHRGVYRQVR